ncbi:MAG: hypothetical protein ACFFDY_01145 [Candidatus Thorarchaeota archaeon]
MAEEILLSLDPDDAVHFGYLDNVDGKIIDAGTTIYQNDNYNNGEALVGFNIVVDLEEGFEPVPKFFKMGSPNQIAPNESKTGFKAVVEGFGGFSDKCAGMQFLTSIKNANYPPSAMKGEVDVKKLLIGLKCHFESKEIDSGKSTIGKDGKYSVTIVTKIYELPEHISGGKTNGKKKAGTTKNTQKASSSPDEIVERAKEYLIKYLSENPDGLLKNKISPLVFGDPDLKGDPDQVKIGVKIIQDAVLKAEDMPYEYDEASNTVKLKS